MDSTLVIIVLTSSLVGGLGLIGLAATLWGADSRPSIGDDHAR
jgi:hypothetical protein